jgi:hypothetical protein
MYWKMGLSFDLPDHRSRDFWPQVVAALNPHGNAGRNVQLNLKVRQEVPMPSKPWPTSMDGGWERYFKRPSKRYNQVAEG